MSRKKVFLEANEYNTSSVTTTSFLAVAVSEKKNRGKKFSSIFSFSSVHETEKVTEFLHSTLYQLGFFGVAFASRASTTTTTIIHGIKKGNRVCIM